MLALSGKSKLYNFDGVSLSCNQVKMKINHSDLNQPPQNRLGSCVICEDLRRFAKVYEDIRRFAKMYEKTPCKGALMSYKNFSAMLPNFHNSSAVCDAKKTAQNERFLSVHFNHLVSAKSTKP